MKFLRVFYREKDYLFNTDKIVYIKKKIKRLGNSQPCLWLVCMYLEDNEVCSFEGISEKYRDDMFNDLCKALNEGWPTVYLWDGK